MFTSYLKMGQALGTYTKLSCYPCVIMVYTQKNQRLNWKTTLAFNPITLYYIKTSSLDARLPIRQFKETA